MRFFAPVLAVLWVGCATQDASDFQYEATFNKRTNGVILHEDGTSGHAGMFGTNCPFDAYSGAVTGDYDLPGQDEEIQDGEPTEVGGISFAAVMPDVVHVVDKTDGEYTDVPVAAPGVVQARLAWDSVVVLDDACHIQRFNFAGSTLSDRALDGCAGADIEVNPADASGVVAAIGHTVLFDAAGLHPLDIDADLVAFDEYNDAYYLARRGSNQLTAIASEGTLRWTVETPYPVSSLDDAGQLESAAVVMAKPNGRGEIAFFDGIDGVRTRFGDTPSPAADLAVSNNGRTLALVRPEQSFFFTLVD